MYNIYVDTEQAHWWLGQATKFLQIGDYTVTSDLEEWSASPDRIALVEILEFSNEVKEKVTCICKNGNMVLIFMPELVESDWCKEFDSPNVFFFVGGGLNFQLNYSEVNLCPYFFCSTKDFYVTNSDLTTLDPTEVTHQIQSIVEHNYNVMMDTDWQQTMHKDIANVLIKYRYLKDHSK